MRGIVFFGLAVLSFAPSPAPAQRNPSASTVPRPGWLPRYTRLDPSLTAAEKATIVSRLDEIERLVLQVPELAGPEGFEVLPRVDATAFEIWPVIQGHPKGNYVTQSYQLMAFRPSKAIAGEGLTCLQIIVNPLPPQVYMDFAMNDFGDGKGDRIYTENRFGIKKPGALLAYGHILPGPGEPPSPPRSGFSATNISLYTVFFGVDGVSPWREVSRQEFLEAMIWDGETKDLKEIERIRQSRTRTRYEQWMEDAPKRKRERDEALAAAEKADPAAAAAARKEALDIERQITEQLRAAEAEERAENQKLLAADTPGDRWRAKLAAMTPEERALPAWTLGSGNDEFFEPNAPEAVRIVRANPAFYGPRSSRIAPRGVVVRFTANLTCHAPAVQRAFHAVYEKLDYGALQRLIGAAPQ